MRWSAVSKVNAQVRQLADRHYSRKTPGATQFAPPGRTLVLVGPDGRAAWVTCWPLLEYTLHGLGDAWLCTLFRNEGAGLSSELIREAVAATRWRWPDVPPSGMVTFVDQGKVRPKRDPGRCFLRAGFVRLPRVTKDRGLVILQLAPQDMPEAEAPIGGSAWLWDAA